jgi:sugar phosphate permease
MQSYESVEISIDGGNELLTQSASRDEPLLISKNSRSYTIRKWSIIIVGCLCYIVGYFHRFTPAVLANMIAPDFNVPVSDLGVFSSMYFWSYGILQPFVGSLADVIEPGYTIGFSTILAAIGSFICGISKTLFVCSIGRLIVGIGCSSIYVSLNKIAANWFSPKAFRIFVGASIGVGGCGSILSQSPLEMLGSVIGWRNCFFVVSAVGVVFGILSLIFVRSHPSMYGFEYHTSKPVSRPLGESIKQIFRNIARIMKIHEFWLLASTMVFGPAMYMDVSGMWGVPYLTDVLGYSNSTASKIQMSLSLAIIIGSPLVPIIGEVVGNRKLTIISFAVISLGTTFVFIFVRKIGLFMIFILFFFFGFGAAATQGVLMGYLKELGDSSTEGTLLGCGNAFCFIAGAIFQNFTAAIINTYDHKIGEKLPPESIILGLWVIAAISLCMFIYAVSFLHN